ncbi:SusC/RagA family TonB-linked outer membrane protein [Nonlabens antarcticus]|uniref:SusC/RagA family TonB-linked outer membrane protein n=1 Tax=Nonlabens antarcticus TaxID=392714 RepID=UPI001891B8AD|nr:TonB-dependent receptor [Nonlabens antarcticus]
MKTKLNGILTLLLALVVQVAFAQQTVTGKVTDSEGLPVLGATVLVKGSQNATTTDFDGNYSISADATSSLTFSYSGYDPKTIVVGNQTVINVTLSTSLDAVVVVAYGTQTTKKNVSSIAVVDEEAIRDIPANSPQELLQGQAAGVQVVQSSGLLGAAPVIKIRGTSTINSGIRPLFVVDGVPLNDAVLTGGQGGQGLNPLANINPNDIASLTVLKDAAATAIYGSRGSNGVVLITTKGGKKNQDTIVTVDVSTGFSESTDTIEMLNADQFRQFGLDAGYFPNLTNVPTGGFDWVDGVTQTGTYENIDVSVQGGGEKTSFFVSANVKNEQGFIIGNGLERRAARINLNHDATDWLSIGANLSYSFTDNDRVGSENNVFAPLTSAYLILPFLEPRDADGAFVATGFVRNVIAVEAQDISRSTQGRLNGNVFGDFKLMEGLNFRTTFGVDRVLVEEQNRGRELNTPGGDASDTFLTDDRFIFTNTLNYAKTFGEVHDVSAIIGTSYEQNDQRQVFASATGFASDALVNVQSGSTPVTTFSSGVTSQLQGYFGRATYAYDSKYVVEGSVRRDGSSRFGENNKFGTFYAGAAGWNISEESFMEEVSWVDNLKIRGSYGITGNDRIGNFNYLALFDSSNYNQNPALTLSSAGNPDLRWERSKSFDLGLSGDLFNNRVRFAIEYYKKNTDDLILAVPFAVATAAGPNTRQANVGEVQNRGFDISISTDNFRTEDFKWTTSFNIGFNENEVLSLPGAAVDAQGRQFISGGSNQRAVVGESINTYFLVRYVGVNPQTGDAEWLDVNGDITNNPSASDRVLLGNANPEFVGGLTNTFRYKGFDLNVLANFSYGNDIFVDGFRFTDNVGSGSFNNRAATLDVWQAPGDNAFVPAFTSATFGRYAQRSTAQLRDGSYLRLKNVTLGYTLPQTLMEKLNVFKSVRLYATATNLVTLKADNLDGIDPEVTDVGGALGQGSTFFTPPQSKSYVFGATFTF